MNDGRVVRGGSTDGSASWLLRWPAIWSALVLVLASPGASFGQTIWNSTTGNWNTPGNWTLGVPNSASGTAFDAVIENGGTAQLLIPGGSVRRLRVGRAAGGGNLLVSGGGLTVTGDFYLNEGGGGTAPASMTVQLGGIVTVPTTVVGYSSTALFPGSSDLSITGPGSRFNATTSFVVGQARNGRLFLADGGTLAIGNGTLPLQIAALAGSSGEVYIGAGGVAGVLQASAVQFGDGSGDLTFNHTGDLTFSTPITGHGGVSKIGSGTTTLSGTNSYTLYTRFSGGTLAISADANLGAAPGSFESQLVFDGGTLRASQSFMIAATRGITFFEDGNTIEVDATKTLTYPNDLILSGSSMTKTGAGTFSFRDLTIGSTGTVNLSGGTLRFSSYNRVGAFNFYSGTIQLTGNRSVGTDAAIADLFGAAPNIPTGKGLTVEGTATLTKDVTLDGGTLTVGGLVNGSKLHFERGTLNVTNQALTIGAGGNFGSTLDLAGDMTVDVTLGIQNQGLVTGDGQLGGPFANAIGGELRAEPGRSLKLTGSGNSNSGQFNLLGGLVEFTQNLANNAGGFISGNGTLIVRNGLVNNGVINFSGSANVIGDVTNSATGKIISAGGGPTTFFDDLTNQGQIRTSAGSFTVFFGAVNGAGTFTGTGTVNFEGDLKPGNSPAAIQFGGDVAFSSEATFAAEIAGTIPGSQYDQILIAGSAYFAGTLDVDLIDLGGGAYVPSVGDQFVLATYARHTGTFNTLSLPPLASGLDWSLDYESTLLMLSVSSTMLPGDIDLDGDVDRTDAALFSQHFGTTAGSVWTTGDFDGDGMTTLHDLALQQANFGAARPSPAASAPVPEPATWVLALVAGFVLVWNRSKD